jgi:hypothetical protein
MQVNKDIYSEYEELLDLINVSETLGIIQKEIMLEVRKQLDYIAALINYDKYYKNKHKHLEIKKVPLSNNYYLPIENREFAEHFETYTTDSGRLIVVVKLSKVKVPEFYDKTNEKAVNKFFRIMSENKFFKEAGTDKLLKITNKMLRSPKPIVVIQDIIKLHKIGYEISIQ